MPCGAYKCPSYGGRYNPNYGSGINSSNAWKLTTVRGAEWASNKQAEGSGAGATRKREPESLPGVDNLLLSKLEQKMEPKGHLLTKADLEEVLREVPWDGLKLKETQRQSISVFIKRHEGSATFKAPAVWDLALQLSQGLTSVAAGVKFGFCLKGEQAARR